MIKGSIHEVDNNSFKYVHAHENMASKYGKQKLEELKEEIDKSTIIVGDFNTNFLLICRTNKQNLSVRI